MMAATSLFLRFENAVANLEMQRLDDSRDSSVNLLSNDPLEDAQDDNYWCPVAAQRYEGVSDTRLLHRCASFNIP